MHVAFVLFCLNVVINMLPIVTIKRIVLVKILLISECDTNIWKEWKCWRSVNRDDATSVGWKCFFRLFELEEGVTHVFMEELGRCETFLCQSTNPYKPLIWGNLGLFPLFDCSSCSPTPLANHEMLCSLKW